MSYDQYIGLPEGSGLMVLPNGETPTEGALVFRLVCPRCGEMSFYPISPEDLINGFDLSCEVVKCTAPGRPGFTIHMEVQWTGLELGLLDRPLKE